MSASNKTATAGVTTLLIIAVIFALNFLVGGVGSGNLRLDLTEDGLFTLSKGTKNILSRINTDEPVTIKFYATNDDRVMPNILKPHARSIEDLLLEYEKQSDGAVSLEVIHPNPDTDDEDKAKDDEIRGMQVNQEGDNIYLGLTVQCLDRKEILPFLNPEDATAFEYDVSRAIAKVIKPTKTVIGLMSAMPIGGVPSMPFQQQRGPEAWAIVQQLRADYEVRDLSMSVDKIDSDITVLLVVHPADISPTAEFAIDQYLLGGGNVVAFVDPQSLLAQAMSSQPNPMTGQPGNMINTSSDLPNLFKAWGISYQKDMVLADMNYRGNLQGRLMPTALQLPGKAINQDDRVTSGLQSFTLVNAGALVIDRKEGLDVITLASSSEASELIDTAAADKLRREPMVNFTASGKKQVLGVHISGKFKTAFPNGKPAAPAGSKETGGPEQDASAPGAAAAKAPEKKADNSLKDSQDSESNVILFSDSDMLYDAFCLRQGDLGVGLITTGGNLPMLLNAVEVLAGGGDLIQVRNRKSPVRPFTKLKEMRETVEEKYRPQLVELEKERQELAEKLSKARPQLDLKKGALIVDQATMNNIKEMEKNSKTIDKEVRNIRKEVNKEVEFRKTLIKTLNVLLVPFLVGMVGLIFAMQRRTRTAAA
ncbi:MAG: Gldg family protein [Prosthecobacter sp.]|uniref:Gldg family protein n=1 Tax=Prosthecobacter sp. TaxID=1965333 RepID=UPI0025FF7C23|nr:Gldg family protein [Prosthecobacter sp.]MCF7786595.1 Gldg family protein [Prosthecobacter sp.]